MANSRKGTIKFIVEVQGDKAAREADKLYKQFDSLVEKQKEFTEGSKEYQDIQKEIDKTNKALKRLEPTYEALTKRKKALEQSLKRLTPGTEEFIEKQKELKEVREKWSKLRDEIRGVEREQKKAGRGTSKLGGMFKRIGKINPFGWIGIVISGLVALFGAFAKSKKGSDLLMKASATLNAVFGSLIRTVNDFIGAIGDIFTKSERPLEDFGKLIYDGITARLRNAMGVLKNLSSSFVKFLKGDVKGARDALNEAGKDFIGIISGKEGDALDKELKVVKETAKQHYELAKAKRANAGSTAALARELEVLIGKEEALQSMADDGTLSIQEQQQATEAALEASLKRAQKEKELAQAQQALINRELNLQKRLGQDVSDLRAASIDAATAVLAAENNVQAVRRENAKKRRELNIQAANDELDLLIDGVDTYKMANERRLNDDRISLKDRKKILEDTKTEFERAYGEQIAVIQRFTDKQIDANDLVNESDTKLLAEKVKGLGLASDIQARLLEIIKERRAGILDISEAEKDLNEKRSEARKKQAKAEEDALELEMKILSDRLNEEARIKGEARQKQLDADRKAAAARDELEQTSIAVAKDGFDTFIQLLSRDEAARKKNFRLIKTFEKAKVLTNLYAEISGIWKNSSSTLPPGVAQAFAVAQTAFATFRAFSNIRNISAQTYAHGGDTGHGFSRDHTGHRVAGVVHDNEYVIPKWMNMNKKYRGIINYLEAHRQRGFASGGFTSPNPQVSDAVMMDTQVLVNEVRALRQDVQSFDRELKAYTVYDDFSRVETEILDARNGAGW